MKSLFFSIFAIFIIASCETSTSPDTKPEGERIGTWMVYDTEAEWIGSQSQSKAKTFTTQAVGDTTHYTEPDGFSLTIFPRQNKVGDLAFTYIDSTIVGEAYHNADIKISSSSDKFDTPGRIISQTSDSLFSVKSYFEKKCDIADVDGREIIYISVITRDSTSADFEKTISLRIDGIDAASRELLQCD